MKCENLILLNYQDNFADNFSSLAYAKILENKTGAQYYYENLKNKRNEFEDKMSDFSIDYRYISSATIEKITQKANIYNKEFIDGAKLSKISKKKKPPKKNNILNLKYFQIDDIENIPENVKKMFNFNNTSFIVNYDVLEKITSQNSIGLYINQKDILSDNVNYDFIYEATKRLNKYVKQPVLFIFSSKEISNKIKTEIDYEIIEAWDWREEFYFLSNCKHKIILNSKNSYSEALWASILNNKNYSITVFDKTIKTTKKLHNWIAL